MVKSFAKLQALVMELHRRGTPVLAGTDGTGLELVRDAEHKAHAVMIDATARAEEAKRLALMESEKEITRAAVLAAEKILREKAR